MKFDTFMSQEFSIALAEDHNQNLSIGNRVTVFFRKFTVFSLMHATYTHDCV